MNINKQTRATAIDAWNPIFTLEIGTQQTNANELILTFFAYPVYAAVQQRPDK